MWWTDDTKLFSTSYLLREDEKEVCLKSLEGDSLSINTNIFYDEEKMRMLFCSIQMKQKAHRA